jgi:GDPmannose 4,6-dehydratase
MSAAVDFFLGDWERTPQVAAAAKRGGVDATARRALVTGITGQDGLYLGELLTARGYDVYGMIRGQSNPKIELVRGILPNIELVEGDLADFSSLVRAVEISQPDEVYNLGAMTSIALSRTQAELTAEITGMGALRLLEALRIVNGSGMGGTRFFQASTSEMFGDPRGTPQNEATAFNPRSPYGVAKAFAHYITVNYRESYDAFAATGILFNHESPRADARLVIRKVARGVARIAAGGGAPISLGNLDARRDWGYAGDYVEAMWRIVQHDAPDDFVVAMGETYSIRDVLDAAFSHVGIEDWSTHVVIDSRFYRPAEPGQLVGDPTRIRERLGWAPRTDFRGMVGLMVDAEMASLTP